jgi:dihydrofolate reductase
MRKLIADEWMSLDGVAQAPGAPDEDTTAGFKHGGWHLKYFDEAGQKFVLEGITSAGGFVFGRRTYEQFAAHWPNASDEEQVIARPLTSLPKFVVSTTLKEPLQWQNSTLLKGNLAAAIRSLKEHDGNDLHVIGSTGLVQWLIEHELIDELRLMIDPLTLGGGKRFFPDDGALRPMSLVSHQLTSTGVMLATYALNVH